MSMKIHNKQSKFTGYEDDVLKLFLICTFKDKKFGGKNNQFGRKSKKQLNSTEFMEFVFSKSAVTSLDGSSLEFIAAIASRQCYIQDASGRGLC